MKAWALIRSRCSCGTVIETTVYAKRHKRASADSHVRGEVEHITRCAGSLQSRELLDPATGRGLL